MIKNLKKLLCLVRSHKLSSKRVCNTGYDIITLETCDRCGKGEEDLALARLTAKQIGIALIG